MRIQRQMSERAYRCISNEKRQRKFKRNKHRACEWALNADRQNPTAKMNLPKPSYISLLLLWRVRMVEATHDKKLLRVARHARVYCLEPSNIFRRCPPMGPSSRQVPVRAVDRTQKGWLADSLISRGAHRLANPVLSSIL